MIKRILFILVLCLLVFTSFVSAATVTGSLTGTNYSQVTTSNGGFMAGSKLYHQWSVNSIEYNANLKSLIVFDDYNINAYDAGASAGETTTFTVRTPTISGDIIATGTMGYQRLWNTAVPPVEQKGYVWFVFDNGWNVTGRSGDYIGNIYFNFSDSAMKNVTRQGQGTTRTPPTDGSMELYGNPGAIYLQTYEVQMDTDYIAVAPMGLGISGNATKGSGTTSRVYIINPISGATIASEGTQTSTIYNFNVDNNAGTGIKIAAQDSKGNFYNSSTLFAGGGLPTPTPTIPTPVPTPTGAGYGDDTTGTFYIKDGLNQTALTGTYIELHYDEGFGDMSIAGTTDGTGKVVFEGLTDGVYYTAMIWRTGYQGGQYSFQATPLAFTKTFYLYPATTSTETIPQQINVSVRAMDKTTYAAISGATVKIQNTLNSESTLYLTTNATGYVTFMGFPNSAYIGGTITKTGYVFQNWNLPYQPSTGSYMPDGDVIYTVELTPASAVTPTGTIVTPTPTPIAIDKLILTATPDSISLGGSTSLTGSSSNATRLTYAGGLRRTSFYVNVHPATFPFDYNMIGQFENVNATYWKFRANTGASWNTPTTATPLTLVNTPTSNGLITYSFNAYDTTGNAIATAGTDDVLVGGGAGGGSLTISSSAYDVSNGNHLSNFQLNITDDASGVVTEFGNVSYEQEITLPRGNSYTLRASKEGYISDGVTSGIKQFIVPTSLNIQKGDFGAIFNVPMFATGSVTAGNTTVSVRVYDVSTYYPLPNVQLTNSYIPTDIKYTVDATAVSWVLPQNTGYTLTAYKDGYCTITESKNTSTNSYQYVPIYMKFGSCAGATPTPTPTGTPTPTITPIGGWGNTTGSAIVCGDLPEDATLIDILKNSMACNGLKDAQSQSLGIACLIILFCAIVLGRIAKGIGVLAGVIAGTVLSTVAGFLPFWIIIVVMIIAGLVFAGKVFWSSGN